MAKIFTVRQLIDELEDYDEDMEVRLMSQPYRRPLAYKLASQPLEEGRDSETDEMVLYIVEGSQIGYVGERY